MEQSSEEHTERLEITTLAQGGDGVARLADGRVIFVPETIPGEVVNARVVRAKRTHAFGEVVDVIEPARTRVPPGCEHAATCGGCQLRHISVANGLQFKVDAALEAIRRISKVEDLPEPIVYASPGEDGWRTKATLRARKTRAKFLLGFLEQGSGRVVSITHCPQLHPDLDAAREALAPLLADHIATAEIVLERAGRGQVVATLEKIRLAKGSSPGTLRAELEAGLDESELLRGVVLGFERRPMEIGQVTVDASVVIEGITSKHTAHQLPAGLFRQANAALNSSLVARVVELASASDPKGILELFSGVGNLTLPLAKGTKANIVALEGVIQCVELGQQIMELHGYSDRVQFARRDLFEKKWPRLSMIKKLAADLVVLDPPRAGAIEVCREIVKWEGLSRVVYVSCDPARLARDMEALYEGGFAITSMEIFDMFPKTSHLETLVVFER